MSYDPNNLPVGGDDGQDYWSLGWDAPQNISKGEAEDADISSSNESPFKVRADRATPQRITVPLEILFERQGVGQDLAKHLEKNSKPFRERVEAAKEALIDGSDEAMLAYLRGESKAA